MRYNFQKDLIRVWGKAVKLYEQGNRDPSTFPLSEEIEFLNSIGMNLMDAFDFAEDWVCEGEPDLATFLLIHEKRKDYFWEIQKEIPSQNTMDPATLPAKNLEIEGVVWLPRIIPKARAKLKGELPSCSMYCCGGDRNFFRTNNIHPAEFLQIVQRAGNDDQTIVSWVIKRKMKTNEI